jgi:hypothetical protein
VIFGITEMWNGTVRAGLGGAMVKKSQIEAIVGARAFQKMWVTLGSLPITGV